MKEIIYILILLFFCLSIIVVPFYIIFLGFYIAAFNSFWIGCGCVFLGLILLRIIKPISVLTHKDYKIF